jgi:hypothetical protein
MIKSSNKVGRPAKIVTAGFRTISREALEKLLNKHCRGIDHIAATLRISRQAVNNSLLAREFPPLRGLQIERMSRGKIPFKILCPGAHKAVQAIRPVKVNK